MARFRPPLAAWDLHSRNSLVQRNRSTPLPRTLRSQIPPLSPRLAVCLLRTLPPRLSSPRSLSPFVPPPARSFREADYGFDLRKKYWLDVQIRDRRAPVRVNIGSFQYLLRDFYKRRGFLRGSPVRMNGWLYGRSVYFVFKTLPGYRSRRGKTRPIDAYADAGALPVRP
jgi:hypothetical protein